MPKVKTLKELLALGPTRSDYTADSEMYFKRAMMAAARGDKKATRKFKRKSDYCMKKALAFKYP